MHLVLGAVSVVVILLAIMFGADAFGARFRFYSVASLTVLAFFGVLTFLEAPGVAAGLPARSAISRKGMALAHPGHPDSATCRRRRQASAIVGVHD